MFYGIDVLTETQVQRRLLQSRVGYQSSGICPPLVANRVGIKSI